MHTVLEEWVKKLEEMTNGQVKSTIYPVGTLCPPPETYEAMVNGVMDMSSAPSGYTPARFPAQMFVCESQAGTPSAAASTEIYTKLTEKFPVILTEFKESHLLWISAHGPAALNTNFPVHSLEDLQGKTLRSPPGGATDLTKALGINPVAMPMDETYISIEKGIVDGMSGNLEVLKSWKLADVTGYTAVTNHYCGPFYAAMNQQTWDSLPANVQEAITELNAWGYDQYFKGWDQVDKDGYDYAASKGQQFYYFTPEQRTEMYALLKPVHDKWAENLESKGMPGKEILQELYRLLAEYTEE
jgi:TRAP-type C4-dicarboxylate transport system substrate-binding protein